MNILKQPYWSPYVVGAGIGILAWIAFIFIGKVLGTSVSFVVIAGLIGKVIAPGHVAASAYYHKYLVAQPIIGCGIVMVIGLFFGAHVSSYLGKSRTTLLVPSIWKNRFGSSVKRRFFWATIGGILLGFGARLAGGCTSGHSISGGLMLALSGWTFTMVLFGVGVASAFLIYRK